MAGGEVYVTFGGDTGALEASLASAKASVSAFTRELGQLAREQVKTGADAESALGQRMLEAAKHLDEAKEHVHGLKEEMEGGEKVGFLEGLNEKLEKLLAPIGGLKVSFGEMIELMAATFAVEQIADWVSETTEAAEKFEQMAAALGVTVEQAQQLSAVTKLAGGDVEEMTSRMEKLQLSLAKTGEKASPAAAALKVLGINLAEFRAMNPAQQIGEMAEAFSRFADGPTKTAAAMALLGKTGADMIPILDKGKEGLAELGETAAETGVKMSGETIEAFSKTQEAIKELSLSWTALSQNIYGIFNNAAAGAVTILTDVMQAMSGSAKSGGLLNDALGLLALAFQELEQFIGETILVMKDLYVAGETATNGLVAAFQGFGKVVADVFQALAAAIPGFFTALVSAGGEAVKAVEQQFIDLGTVIGDTLKLNFAGAKTAFDGMGTDLAASGAKISGAFNGVFDFSSASEDAKKTTERLAEIIGEGDKKIVENAKVAQKEYDRIWGLGGEKKEETSDKPKPPVPQMDIGGAAGKAGKDTAGKDAEQQFAEEVQAAKDAEALIQEGLDERLKTHQITMAQWVAQSVAALDREQDAIQDAGDKAVASAGLTAQQKKAILLKEEHDVAEIALKEQKAFDKAFEEIAASAKSAADKIADAMNSQVDSLLRGKETVQQAFKNMAASMIEDAIKYCIKWAAEHAATVAMNIAGIGAVTAAQTTGTAIQTAAVVTGSSAVVGDVVAAKTAVVGSDAGQAAAGVAAWLAPFIGPAAIPAGAAAGATVGGIGMMDIGAWDVPQDQLAFVHKNELVATASQATGLRNLIENGGGGGGGDTHNYNTGGITVHNHGQPADGETLAKQYLAGLKRKGVFAGNSARRYAARA
jgi:hypothetical protein